MTRLHERAWQMQGAAKRAAPFAAALLGVGLCPANAQGPSVVPPLPPQPKVGSALRTIAPGNENPKRLLHEMVKANEQHSFIAEEVTLNENGQETEQQVYWHPKLGLRRESVRPSKGDILIDNFKSSWVFTGGKWNQHNTLLPKPKGRVNDVLQSINSGELRATWEGQDKVAGRVADIVRVASAIDGQMPTRRFWIDRATGVRLKSEDIGPAGRTLSTSYYLSISIDAPMDEHLLDPPTAAVAAPVDKSTRYNTLDAARRAGVEIHAPDFLPPGFSLRSIEVAGVRAQRVTQRYTNGLLLVSLYSAPKMPFGSKVLAQLGPSGSGFLNGPRGLRAYVWHDAASGLNFALLSNLPNDQIQRIANSVR